MPYGYHLEAEYESGFILREDDADHSPYDPTRNICHAIVNDRPTQAGHGRLVRFSLIGSTTRYDLDWTTLPDDARPIYFRRMERSFAVEDGWQPAVCASHHFGWQGTVNGTPVQEITDIAGS